MLTHGFLTEHWRTPKILLEISRRRCAQAMQNSCRLTMNCVVDCGIGTSVFDQNIGETDEIEVTADWFVRNNMSLRKSTERA